MRFSAPAPASSAYAPGAALIRRPSVFQAGHIPSWHGSCERYALSLVAAARRWSLLLLSSLLSAASRVGGERDWVVRVQAPQLEAVFR